MTYILGARCKDGIVLVADRKFKLDYGYGISYEYGSKIIGDLGGVIIGFSGGRGTFEVFRTEVRNFVRGYDQTKGNLSHDILLVQISEIMNKLYTRYHRSDSFEALVALCDTTSVLKYFHDDGRFEPVLTNKAIGTGTPFGSSFMKTLLATDMTMEQVAEIGYFIVEYIQSFELDMTVGVDETSSDNNLNKPEIWFIHDGLGTTGHAKDHHASEITLNLLEQKTEQRLVQYRESIEKLFAKNPRML